MKLMRIVIVGLCLLVVTEVSSVLSTAMGQQNEGTEKLKAAPAQQAAPPAGAETKVVPPATAEDARTKAQTATSPAPRQPDEKTLRKFQATENCAGG